MVFHISHKHARLNAPGGHIVGFRVLICKGDCTNSGREVFGDKPEKINGRECESELIQHKSGPAIRVFDSQKIYPQYVIDFI
jgi:hypothetical protein